jgi:hypothetical protein
MKTKNIKPGDYIVGRELTSKTDPSKIKHFVICVTAVDPDSVMGWLERDDPRGPRRDQLEVQSKQIVLNLGPKPTPGKVYGCDVGRLWVKTFEHPFWGPIHFYTKLDKDCVLMLRKALDSTAKTVEKLKLESYVDLFHTEIRAKSGKYAGMYLHSKEEGQCRVWYAPEWAQQSMPTMQYVILHEFGHVLRYHGLTDTRLRSKWLKLYNRSVAKNIVDKSTLKGYLKSIVSMHGQDENASFQECVRNITSESEDDQRNMRAVLKWFRDIHRLSPKDLEVLWSADQVEHIEKLWPTDHLDISKLDPLVSEYALKNVEELWAESFAMYANKTKLPQKVVTLLEHSLSVVRDNAPRN